MGTRELNALMAQIAALSAWAATTCLIDFLAIPTVFKSLSDVEGGVMIGGGIGAALFGAYNWPELIFALLFVGLLFARRVHFRVILMTLGLVLLGLVLVYMLYLVPNIRSAFELMRAPGIGDEAMAFAQEKMDPLHRAYIFLDSLKLLLLMAGIGALFADARALRKSGDHA